ncbi:SURF1 family protein [Paracidovorax sp. MALMAid1276]|uniref:SURF1 family protein n=1 Tax=Paracidovorax sp. MALMAid1276 TaxID=3411631 RepID=UPI003B9B5846
MAVDATAHRGRSRPHSGWTLAVVALVGVALFAAFTALGLWQVQRRAWKLDLIERTTQRIHAPPAAAPPEAQWAAVRAASHEYQAVQLRGEWLARQTLLSQATTALGAGYWVMTPLQQHDGTQVLVNRGFVPADQRLQWAERPAEHTPGGAVTVQGLLRISEPGGGFLRRNDPAQNRWHSRDVEAMAQALSLSRAAPYFVDAGLPQAQAPTVTANTEQRPASEGPWPREGLTVVRFTNTHLSYALTWFAMALMVAGAGGLVARYELRLRASSRAAPPP